MSATMTTLTEMGKQVPALAVLVLLVFMFGKHIDKQAERQEKLQSATNEVLQQAITVMDRCERTFKLKDDRAGKVAVLAEEFASDG